MGQFQTVDIQKKVAPIYDIIYIDGSCFYVRKKESRSPKTNTIR